MRQSVRAIVQRGDELLVMRRNRFGHEFYALVGGGIDEGETPEQALYREVKEETGIAIASPRIVLHLHAGPVFGMQYIYLCRYVSGEPALSVNSEEANAHAEGGNLYEPCWLPIEQLTATNLLPVELRSLLHKFLTEGFPDKPVDLTIQA